MKKIMSLFLIFCFLLPILSSCAQSNKDFAEEQPSSNGVSSGESLDKEITSDDKSEIEDARKIIKRYNLTLETKLFKEDCGYIVSEAEKLGGYIASSSISGSSISGSKNSSKNANYMVRIPSQSVDSYVSLISERCNVIVSDLTTEDITESYYGIRAQIDSLVIQEENLLEMLEKADNLHDMIMLDDKLSEVRAQINELNYKLQNMDKSANYSYVYISLREVVEYQTAEKTYWQELGETVIDSAKNFADVIGAILLLFVWIFPFATVIAVVTVVIIIAANRSKRKKNKKQNESKDR